jgi:photosystem II stability/assembly factor-like uncharacterized protein
MKLNLFKCLVLSIWLLAACGPQTTPTPSPSNGITFAAERTDLQAGECTVLRWEVTEGFGVTLDGQQVEKTDQRKVCPTETRGYELKVDLGTRMETRTVEIVVGGAPGQPGGTQPPVTPGTPAYQSAGWMQLGGPPGGLGYDIRYDFSDFERWYVTDDFAGFFYSMDRGLTWTNGNQGLPTWGEGNTIPVFSATVDPHNPAIVWTGLDHLGHIYKSTDRAQTWVQMDNGVTPNNGLSFRGFSVDPRSSDIVYAAAEVVSTVFIEAGKKPQGTTGSGGRVYRTTDGGKNWELIWEGDALARYVWVAPDDPNRIYVSTGIFDRFPLNFPQNATPDNAGGVGILRSADGGRTWTTLGAQNGLHCLSIGSLYIKPDDSRSLLAGAGSMMGISYETVNGQPDMPFGGVYLTTDGGDHWQEVIPNEHIGAVEYCQQNPSIAYAASERAVFRSNDGGQTWTQRSSADRPTWGPPGLSPGMPIDMQTDPQDCDRVFINNYVGGNFLSEDGGQTWMIASRGYTGADPPRVFVDPTNAAHVWTVTRMAPWESPDGGFTWNPMAYPALIAGGETMGMDPANARHVLIDSMASLFETEDGGQTWSKRLDTICPADVGEAGCEGTMFSEIVFAPSDPQTVYAGSRNTSVPLDLTDATSLRGTGIAKSTDGGETWTRLTDPKIARLGIVAIAVSPTDPQVVYAGGSAGAGVFKSTDGGQSWNSASQGLLQPVGAVRALAIDPADPNHIFMGGEQGLFVSTDGAASWTQVAAGLDANARVSDIIFDAAHPGVVYAATLAGVVYSTDGGQSFLPLNQGLNERQLAATSLALSADGSVLYATGVGVFRLGTP